MAKLIIQAKGNRGSVSRLSNSTAVASINGWNTGLEIAAEVLNDGCIEYSIYTTFGSNKVGEKLLRDRFIVNDNNR